MERDTAVINSRVAIFIVTNPNGIHTYSDVDSV